MPFRQQKSARKVPEMYLMFEPNHILVTLSWDQGPYPGHKNICQWFFSKEPTLDPSQIDTNNDWLRQN